MHCCTFSSSTCNLRRSNFEVSLAVLWAGSWIRWPSEITSNLNYSTVLRHIKLQESRERHSWIYIQSMNLNEIWLLISIFFFFLYFWVTVCMSISNSCRLMHGINFGWIWTLCTNISLMSVLLNFCKLQLDENGAQDRHSAASRMKTLVNKPPRTQTLSVVYVLITQISSAIANFSVVLRLVSQLASVQWFWLWISQQWRQTVSGYVWKTLTCECIMSRLPCLPDTGYSWLLDVWDQEQKMTELSLWFKNGFAVMIEKLCKVVVWEKSAEREPGSYLVGRTNGNERHINENVLWWMLLQQPGHRCTLGTSQALRTCGGSEPTGVYLLGRKHGLENNGVNKLEIAAEYWWSW